MLASKLSLTHRCNPKTSEKLDGSVGRKIHKRTGTERDKQCIIQKRKALSISNIPHGEASVCVGPCTYLLLGDTDVARVWLEGPVRLPGEHPVAAEGLAEHGLQQNVRFLRVVDHHHQEGHRHHQAGGYHRLPLEGQRHRVSSIVVYIYIFSFLPSFLYHFI